MNLDQPTQQQFQQAQTILQSIVNDYSADIDTRKASAVRQLVIRPYAYIFAQADKYIANRVKESSISYLLTSNKTENQIADMVASNYFVTRLDAGYARGIVTAKSTMSSIRISKNTTFYIDGHAFAVEKTVIGVPQPGQDTEDIDYIKTVQLGSYYVCNIPVVSKQAQLLQIPQGVQVTTPGYVAGVQFFFLSSPITGGAAQQTDAQMMRRCVKKCGASVGTQNAIWTRLQQAPVDIKSCKAQGSNQVGCFRSRYNNLALPIGGIVDTYIKTQNQASYKDITLTVQNKQIVIDSSTYPQIAGFIRVSAVVIQSSDVSKTTPTYTVTYSSNDKALSDQGARLSQKQKATITFADAQAGKTARVTVMYLPGVVDTQTYMANQDVSFIGQDILIKAAVPVTLIIEGSVTSTVQLSQTALNDMKQFIASQINTIQVGQPTMNMDDVAKAFRQAYPQAELKLPYSIQVKMPMTNGGYYTFNTENGYVDLTFRQSLYFWNTAAYFYSTTADQIKLNVL